MATDDDCYMPPVFDASLVEFHEPIWLSQFPLTEETALDYFKLSTAHYDPTSINGILDMQLRFLVESGRSHTSQEDSMQDPTTMIGIEYVLIFSNFDGNQSLFVIQKHFRQSPTLVTPQLYYYILNGFIYQSPNLNVILQTRILTLSHYLQDALKTLNDTMTYDTSFGYRFARSTDIKDKETLTSERSHESKVQDLDQKAIGALDIVLTNMARHQSSQFLQKRSENVPVVAKSTKTKAETIKLGKLSNPKKLDVSKSNKKMQSIGTKSDKKVKKRKRTHIDDVKSIGASVQSPSPSEGSISDRKKKKISGKQLSKEKL